ncbi:membrane-bound lytic murein transglycosylase D [Bathymodiolus platifrons methanotrophic gill symbiont]|uniref:LysM peptidoglycan-binding domain-containing protein n=1 Tax=Bathymodiolus platifrons methanotrophic gill symbiont TaxID=113268 RepID=UPI0011C9506D|nr:LysM peptidoglycan-binding domain-containing protein [Bathymodiolus platifrons methanotrophic gill symbiont]TXK95493.1 lytic transglycosylase [Methylococcaceae bacterium HT1]TXL15353.1 lytic transglycosylase [Methylococcaceae bacterium HT3]TXL21739.1 lytic transglycosylase [Methylococcaceae bacterium HT2]GFO74367.1 membrane-bound lytic murein transglycosylase D [Bathymodiolus platifrons methanotrophic gill symbiont]
MQKFNQHFSILILLMLLFVQGCSLKNTNQVANPDPDKSIIDLAHKSGLAIDPSSIKGSDRVKNSDDSWQYLISLFAIPEIDDALIEKQLNWYLAHPKYIETIQTRAEPYLYNIIKQVEEKGLPGEFALLPAVESGFKAHVYSRAKASGLWQFIPSTGRLYGLDQNWWYDGRRDVYASTEAATSYLKKLGGVFDNDWLLALASYNAGMGTVGRAIKRNAANNKATDFWSLSLPRETKNYVPRLLALAKIFANAEQYGISLKTQTHKPTFMAIDIGSQLELSKAAQLSNTTVDELFHLNPGLSRGYTPPQGPHRLLIPIDNAELFKKNLAALPVDQRVQWQRHKIKTGENLGAIARRYKTRINAIREVNHLPNNNIRAGAYLLIPVSRKQAGENPFYQASTAKIPSHKSNYRVKAGDSLWGIARKLGLHSKDIAQWNKIGLNNTLSLGQTLVIRPPIKQTASKQSISYTVRSGDSLYAISEKFNVSVADLRKWNASTLGKYLKPGQTLTVKSSQPAT